MALDAPFDIMEVRLLDEPKIIITSKDGFPLPSDPAQNTAGAPLLEMLAELNGDSAAGTDLDPSHPVGFEVLISKNIKPGSGIGSSAASAAGAVVSSQPPPGQPLFKRRPRPLRPLRRKSSLRRQTRRQYRPLHLRRHHPHPLHLSPRYRRHPRTQTTRYRRTPADRSPHLRRPADPAQTGTAQRRHPPMGQYRGPGGRFDKRRLRPHRTQPRRRPHRTRQKHPHPRVSTRVKTKCKTAGALGGGISGSGPSIFMLSRDQAIPPGRCEIMHAGYLYQDRPRSTIPM